MVLLSFGSLLQLVVFGSTFGSLVRQLPELPIHSRSMIAVLRRHWTAHRPRIVRNSLRSRRNVHPCNAGCCGGLDIFDIQSEGFWGPLGPRRIRVVI